MQSVSLPYLKKSQFTLLIFAYTISVQEVMRILNRTFKFSILKEFAVKPEQTERNIIIQ